MLTFPSIVIALGSSSRAVADHLSGTGAELRVAKTGLEVVASLFPRGDELSCQPSLMVLSAFLPGYNGLSILAGIRSLGWRTPVILSWPTLHPWVYEEALRLGVAGLYEEPVMPEDLHQAIVLELARQALEDKDRPQLAG